MTKFKLLIKKQFFLGILYNLLFYIILTPLLCFCYEPAKTVVITKEDILNAVPVSPYPVEFSQKELKTIKMLERRHFGKNYDDMNDDERLLQLEYEILGKVWKYTPKKNRIKTLETASSNYMLQGMALPASIGSERNARRLTNDSVQYRKKDDVGLIDGFLRLLSPEKYEVLRAHSKRHYDDWSDTVLSP